MNSIVCCLLIIVALCVGELSAVNSCFFCQSKMHAHCDDPFSKGNGTFVDCKKFLEAETAPVVASRSFQPAKPFDRLYEPKRFKRSARIEFRCTKTEVEYSDSTIEMIRMCVPVISNHAACPQLRQAIGSGFLLKSCHECNEDNCNHSNRIATNFLLTGALFLYTQLNH